MKQNGVVCLPGPALLFFIFRFEYLISGPKSYRDFRETGPRTLSRLSQSHKMHLLAALGIFTDRNDSFSLPLVKSLPFHIPT